MKTMTSSRPTDRGDDAGADRVGAEASGRSSAPRGRSASPAARPSAGSATGSATSSCVKLPVIRPSSVMRASMRGADCTRPSRMIASWRPMFSPVTLPNLRRALVVQREADRRLVVLVERRPRVAQVAAGDRRHLAHQVVRRAPAASPGAATPGHDLHARRHLAVDAAALRCDGDGPCSTIFSSSRPVDG